jgi:hypothetical protein
VLIQQRMVNVKAQIPVRAKENSAIIEAGKGTIMTAQCIAPAALKRSAA